MATMLSSETPGKSPISQHQALLFVWQMESGDGWPNDSSTPGRKITKKFGLKLSQFRLRRLMRVLMLSLPWRM